MTLSPATLKRLQARINNHEHKLRAAYPSLDMELMKRLNRLEAGNRGRARRIRKKTQQSMAIEKLNFIQVCVEHDWKCSICGEPIDPMNFDGMHPDSLTFEHNIALSGGGDHIFKNSSPAHRRCNMAKNEAHDKTKAAKLKRMSGETGQYARRKKNGSKMQSRPFQKPTRPHVWAKRKMR